MENTNVKETISEEIMKEATVMSGTTAEVTGMATAVEVQENTAEVVDKAVGEATVAKTNVKNEDVEEFNKNLPPITGKERNVILANANEKYAINMQSLRNTGNMRNLGVAIYLSDIETGDAYIDDSAELMLKKEKIVNGDVKVMDVLDQFTIPISIDTKKIAFGRAQEYLKIASMATNVGTGMTISEVCRVLVTYAIEMAKVEIEKGVKEEDRLFHYDEIEKRAGIRADHFQKVLDMLETGYKKGVFGKKIRIEEARTGKEILICNRSGSGYGFNMTGNARYYMFNIKGVLG